MAVLDTEQLRTFVAVLEAGSLTAAAPRVFLSQSAVSEQMRKLEQRVGQPLLLRGKMGVSPTAAGTRLAVYARQLLALSEQALRDLQGEALAGELRLAVTDYFRPGELSRMLSRLGAAYPQLRLHVSVLKSAAIEAGYSKGEFDVGLSMRILASGRAGAAATAPRLLLRQEPLLWMGAVGMQLAPEQPLRLLLLPETCSLHRFTVQCLRAAGLRFSIAHTASGVAGLQSALAAGLGVACLNESALGEGIAPLGRPQGLPALPRAAFQWLPARKGESTFVARAREVLAAQLA